jgi:hypothetical protein
MITRGSALRRRSPRRADGATQPATPSRPAAGTMRGLVLTEDDHPTTGQVGEPVLGRETVLGSAEFGPAPTPLRVSRKKAFQFRSNTVR